MIEYVDVFREEAKSLFQSFKNNEETAVARCTKVFGDKKNLTLMNIQHVIAKEYGFNQWNDIVKAQKWDLAVVLNEVKDKTFTSPLITKWDREHNHLCGSGERSTIVAGKPRETLNFTNFTEAFSNGYVIDNFQINATDVSGYDMSGLDVAKSCFDEYTIWPDDETKLPRNFNPKEFLEKRKNPGLGVYELHKQGITGTGRNVAMISEQIVKPHLEYRENLVDYIDINPIDHSYASIGGQFIATLCGKTCGVAPKAQVYYYRVNSGNERTQINYAKALEMVCDLHQKLISEGKNGIDVVCIPKPLMSKLFENEYGHLEFAKAYDKAEKLGIWVNVGDIYFEKTHKPAMQLVCKADGDVDNPNDYINVSHFKLPDNLEQYINRVGRFLALPARGRTVADSLRLDAYSFDSICYYQKSFECGLYVLAKSVRERLTPDEFWKLVFDTGDEILDGIAVVVNPKKLIEALRR